MESISEQGGVQVYTYQLDSNELNVLLSLDKQRQDRDENLCDCILTVGDASAYAHRSVLAIKSPYFEGMFSGAFRDGREAIKKIDLSYCVPDISYVENYLTYVYSGVLRLSVENIPGMVHLADFLLTKEMSELCQTFMKKTLTLSCCLDYVRMLCQYRLRMTYNRIFDLVRSRFHDHLVHEPAILHLPPQFLLKLLKFGVFQHMNLRPLLLFLAAWVNTDSEGHTEDSARVDSEDEDGSYVSCSKARLETACTVTDAHTANMTSHDLDLECRDLRRLVQGSSHVVRTLAGRCLQKLEADSRTSESHTEVDKQLTRNVSVSPNSLDSSDRLSSEGSEGVCCNELDQPGSSSMPDRPDRPDAAHTTQQSSSSSVDQGLNVADTISTTQSTAGRLAGGDSCHPAPGEKRSHDGQLEENNDNCVQLPNKRKKEEFSLMEVHQLGKGSSPGEAEAKVSYETEARANTWNEEEDSVEVDGKADMLVAFVPDEETVNYSMTISGARNRPRHCVAGMVVCVYHVQRRTWFRLGSTPFPQSFRESDGWRLAVVRDKAYFISLPRKSGFMLDLRTLTWDSVGCQELFIPICHPHQVRSILPIAVDDQLYALVSDRQPEVDLWDNKMCRTQQKYYRFHDDGTWHGIGEVTHQHMSMPLNVISVDGGQVYVAKLTMPFTEGKSILMVQEGHVFDTLSDTVTKFSSDHLYCEKGVRLFVRDSRFHIIDSSGQHSSLPSDEVLMGPWASEQQSPELAYVSNVLCAQPSHPCLTHVRCSKGDSSWEYLGMHRHRSKLIQLRLGEDRKISSIEHPPPPFSFVSQLTTAQISEDLVGSLEPCRFIHTGVTESE